jgi:hypothetical protein
MAISSGPNKNALGLVLVIDAANPKSYTGLGTTLSNAAATSVIHKANIKNGPTYIGQWFGSLNFDDNDDFLVISNDATFQTNTGTLYAWVKTGITDPQLKSIITKNNAYGIYLRNGLPIVIDWSTRTEYKANTNISDGNWHFITFTFNSGVSNGSNLYVDGVLKNTFTITVGNQLSDIYIGARGITPNVVQKNVILHLEASNTYSYPGSGNTWYDLSPYGRNATLVNSPTFDNTSGGALVFNGSSSYAEISNWNVLTGNKNFSIANTVKYQNNSDQVWISYGTGTSSSATQIGIGSSQFGLLANNVNTTLENSYLIPDTWNHLVLTHDGAVTKLYVNGSYVKQKLTTYNVGSSNLFIGKSGITTSFSSAKVANVIVYNKTLTADEVSQTYDSFKNFYVNLLGERTLGTISNPAPSGFALKLNYPDLASGYYYIKSSLMPNALLMYVDMTNDGGGFDYYRITGGTSINFITSTHSGIALGLDLIYPRSQGHWKSMYEFSVGVLGVSLNSVMAICGAVTRNTQLNGSGNYTNVIMRDPNNYLSGALDWKVPDGGRWWLRDLFYAEPNGDYSYDAFLSFSGVSPDGSNLTYNDGYSSYSTGTSYLVSTNAKP